MRTVALIVLLVSVACSGPRPATATAPAASAPPMRAEEPARALVVATIVVPVSLRSGPFASDRQLQVREGFSVSLVARVAGARSMALSPWGELLVTQPREGRIVAINLAAEPDTAAPRVLAEGLQCPYGMAFHGGRLYVAQSTRVQRFPYDEGGRLGAGEAVVGGLPDSPCGPHHYRPLAIDAGGNLYVAFGSSCNVCVEADARRGTVWRYGADGSAQEYARGLRNVVDLEVHPESGVLWGVTNERDQLGDDVPPDPVGPILAGADYGWPYCYRDGGQWVVDRRVPARNPTCQGLTEPDGIQAHSAPLGLAFYTASQFPPEYLGSLFVGLHGSWNRSEGTGFKVVRIPVLDGRPLPAEDFVTGWLTGPRGPNDAWGRPVDVQVGPDGSLYVTDDRAGAVYRVSYTG